MQRVLAALALVGLLPASTSAGQTAGPADGRGLQRQAEAARLENRPDEAIPLYRNALGSRPDWAEGWFHLGTLLYARDDWRPAAEAFRRAASLAPEVGTAWVMLGLCEFRLGSPDEALAHIQKGRRLGISADPQLRRVVLYHEGILLLDRSEFDRAQETLGLLGSDGVDDEHVTIALGRAVLRVGAAEVDEQDARQRELLLRAGRAEHLAVRKDFAAAERAYEQLAAELPQLRNVHYALGRYYVQTHQPQNATAAYARELDRHPDHVPALLGIAAIRAETDPASALPYAERAVALNPRIPLGHYLLGSLLLRTGEIDRAIVELEIAEQSVRSDPGVYYALARAYARAGRAADADRARAEFKRLTDEQQAAAVRTGN